MQCAFFVKDEIVSVRKTKMYMNIYLSTNSENCGSDLRKHDNDILYQNEDQ